MCVRHNRHISRYRDIYRTIFKFAAMWALVASLVRGFRSFMTRNWWTSALFAFVKPRHDTLSRFSASFNRRTFTLVCMLCLQPSLARPIFLLACMRAPFSNKLHVNSSPFFYSKLPRLHFVPSRPHLFFLFITLSSAVRVRSICLTISSSQID
jgi:hypothetical protein